MVKDVVHDMKKNNCVGIVLCPSWRHSKKATARMEKETGEAQHEWLNKETSGGVEELSCASETTSVSGNDRFSHLQLPKAVSNNILITLLCSLLHSLVTSIWDCDIKMDRPPSSGRFRWAASPVSP